MSGRPYKARNAVEQGVYRCDTCGCEFRLEGLGDMDFPDHYEINCPLCGNFPRR